MVQTKITRGIIMEVAYYNLSGGINQALTKTDLGSDPKKIFWSDSENIEIYRNRGIIKQKGNVLVFQLTEKEPITGMHEMSYKDHSRLIITTESGKIYIYDNQKSIIKKLEKTLTGVKPYFTDFLNGTLVITESDRLFYIKNNDDYDIVDCKLNDHYGKAVTGSVLTIYRGRVWVAKGSTIYYSALGTYNDFTTEEDAGYISDFHTNTDEIVAIKPYKDYLAIYKKDMVYLLTGISPDDFSIVPFANKGTVSSGSIVNVENKQYFMSNGIFALEQVGELNQIQLGSEISLKIKPEFSNFNKPKLNEMICIHYEDRNQMWYFIPYANDDYFHTVWINDYVNKSWYKRIIPQNIVTACMFEGMVYTADNQGRIYKEDFGTTFCGEPVKFLWKSPFLAIGNAHHRKTIDEFYFLLDEEYDNDFEFTIYKDYDSGFADDKEHIYSVHPDHLIWADDEMIETYPCKWTTEDENVPVWSVNRDTMEKAEISEANYSIQICISGDSVTSSCAIIGLQFREIYNDD